MSVMQRTSILICLTVFVVFFSVGILIKWPDIQSWLNEKNEQGIVRKSADPFAYDPPLPSLVKDLRPRYRIHADLHSSDAKITGKMVVEFDNPRTADVRLYLYDYPWSPMRITSIRAEGKPLAYERRQNVIHLKNPAVNQSRMSLALEFETAVPRRGTRFGVKDDIWTLTAWYPMLGALNPKGTWYEPPQRIDFGDPFVYHYADYDVTFVSPQGYQWVSSWGRGEVQLRENGRQEVRYQGRRLLNFALVGSPLYHVETIAFEPNLTVDIASVDRESLKRIKAIAEQVFPVYIKQFGTLPYPHAAIAETAPGTTYAMEYANMAIFKRDLFAHNLVDHWLPHEVAHMWWYNSIATLEAASGWLDEGLVEMSVYHYQQKRYGKHTAERVLQAYRDEVELLRKHYPGGSLGKTLHQFHTYDEFKWTWYAKGALLYNHLRQQIGDAAYQRFLQRVQLVYHGSVIGPEHLDHALGQALGGEARYFAANVQQTNADAFVPLHFEPYVTTMVNGASYYAEVPSRVKAGTVYLPLRSMMERLGYRVGWSAKDGAIRIEGGGNDILLREGERAAQVNGKRVDLGNPLVEIRERTMVPLSFFQRVLKWKVTYQQETRTVKIMVPEPDGR